MAAQQSRSRVRSPVHPTQSLPEAIEKARRLYEQEHRTPATVEVVAEAWGYEPTSSSVAASIATLKHYGLLDQTSGSGGRRVSISDRAFDILIEPEGSNRRDEAIREAALAPDIFSELWSNFGDRSSDANIRSHLLRSGFNRRAVAPCIRAYRGTILFAGLQESATIEPEDHNDSVGIGIESQIASSTMIPLGTQPATAMRVPSPRAGYAPVTVLMDDGSVQVVNVPRFSDTEFQFFKDQLETFRKAILKPDPSESTEQE